ncbi:MAG: rRNA maturation RNase YbeY [Alphaproteobacteria bacterium]|nr:rRNA maturation RNase YbeY [Alphaproteobacteria bacterium]
MPKTDHHHSHQRQVTDAQDANQTQDLPPDLLITTKNNDDAILWHEQNVLDAVLPALAYGYQYVKPIFPNLHQTEISLLLCDDKTITALNKQWRDKEKPTNVLSFSQFSETQLKSGHYHSADNFLGLGLLANDGDDTAIKYPQFKYPQFKYPLGDIVMSFETCKAEAEAGGIDFYHHITHLFIHGFLHLLGYDHQHDDEAHKMQQAEIAILAKSAINNPYLPKRHNEIS